MHFGARLETVARNIPPCSSFADIGTDHAYLPVLLLQQCKIEKAVAGDVVPGPCEAARKTVHSFASLASLTFAWAPASLWCSLGSARCLPSAAWGRDHGPRFGRVPPGVAASQLPGSGTPAHERQRPLRHWCEQHGWAIAHEDLAQEGERLYEILVLKPQPGWKYPGTCYLVGQDLVDQHHPLLEPFVTQLQDKYLKLLASMEKSPRAIHTPQYREYQETAKQLEEILRGNNGN